MIQWMYYVLAAVVAGVVLFLLINLTGKGQATTINATNFHNVKKRQFAAIQTLERDFRNLGASKRLMAGAIIAVDTTCSTSDNCEVSFWTRVDDDTLLNDPTKGLYEPSNADSIAVQYLWRPAYVDAGVIPDRDSFLPEATTTVDLYAWQRRLSLDGVSWSDPTHNLDRSIAGFRVVPFDIGGAVTMSDSLMRQFYIEMELLTPRGIGKDMVDISRWETFVRPVNLTRLDQEE